MSAMCLLQVLALVSHLTLLIAMHSNIICPNFKFVINEDVVYNHILEGHVFKRLTVYSAAQCHMMCKDDCLCASINYFPVSRENNCELNDVNKEMEPAALKWKQGVNCYDLARSYTVKVSCNCSFLIIHLFIRSFVRSFVRSLVALCCSFARSLARSFGLSVGRSLARWLVHLLICRFFFVFL